MKPIIGTRDFVDGSVRTVYLDDDGRQFVIGDDGEAVHDTYLAIVASGDMPLSGLTMSYVANTTQ